MARKRRGNRNKDKERAATPAKTMTAPELDDLRHHIQGMLENILRNADAFIFEHEASASEAVSVQVRKLALTDAMSLWTYEKPTNHPNLLALAYGGADHILVNGGSTTKRSPDDQGDLWVPVAPDLSIFPESLITVACNGTQHPTLEEWLNSYVTGCYAVGCRCAEGEQQSEKVTDLISLHANKEGAHRENRQRQRGIAIFPDAATQASAKPRDFDVAWQQFVVGAGLKIAFAEQNDSGRPRSIIDMKWFIRSYPHWQAYMAPNWHKRLLQRGAGADGNWHTLRLIHRLRGHGRIQPERGAIPQRIGAGETGFGE